MAGLCESFLTLIFWTKFKMVSWNWLLIYHSKKINSIYLIKRIISLQYKKKHETFLTYKDCIIVNLWSIPKSWKLYRFYYCFWDNLSFKRQYCGWHARLIIIMTHDSRSYHLKVYDLIVIMIIIFKVWSYSHISDSKLFLWFRFYLKCEVYMILNFLILNN